MKQKEIPRGKKLGLHAGTLAAPALTPFPFHAGFR